MKTQLDCFPCLIGQALNTAKKVAAEKEKIHTILKQVCLFLPTMSLDVTPSEFGREVYRIVSSVTGITDPFQDIKKLHTQQALKLYPKLKKQIQSSEDPLMTAIRISIAGNVIDFGTPEKFDMEKDLETILKMDFAVNHYEAFCKALKEADTILFIGDNAGETVFDSLLIEELGKPVTYAVRERPIINDATFEDAVEAGIDKVAEIFSSGCDAPGCILSLCSDKFLELYHSVDLIISKGQGNYEGLSDEIRPIFFLLKAKCSVVASDIGVPQGSIILKKANNFDECLSPYSCSF
ncbi:MAG: ARMT1-like domain-containing protein [Candidatus Aminicenantes bacterium]|nr:ARMT1-like domain-containing protein [Candidatus Aminicenantes bacterium]